MTDRKSTYDQENFPYILVSYYHKDQNRVLPLIRHLDARNGGSFYVKYDSTFKLPMEMDSKKAQEIEKAHAILVFVSKEFKSSRYFDEFMYYTKQRKKTVIIAYLDYVSRIPAALGLPVKTYHYMRFDDMEEFSDELSGLAELSECCRKTPIIDFSFTLMNQYRTLIPVQPDFFMAVKEDDEDLYDMFENYTEFHRDGRKGMIKRTPEEICELAVGKLKGTYYERRDPYGAVALLEEAASMNYLPAIRKLADCYQDGIGTKKNFVKAEQCFRKAALMGDPASMLILALFLSEGRSGVKINREEAFYWLKKAAAEGNASAWYYLGFCYEHGSGTRQDISEALNCYKIGAAENDFRSKQAYNALCRA